MNKYEVTLVNGNVINVHADDVHTTPYFVKFLNGKGKAAELQAAFQAGQVAAVVKK